MNVANFLSLSNDSKKLQNGNMFALISIKDLYCYEIVLGKTF